MNEQSIVTYLEKIEEEKIYNIISRFDSPFHFYNLNKLKTRLSFFSSLIDNPKFRLWYACKANPLSAILKIFRNLGFGIDIASIGELTQVLNIGITNKDILATGPAKSKDYLRELLKNGVNIIVAESVNQLLWLDQVSKELSCKPDVLLRVQLKWEGEKSVLGGSLVTPFGEDIETWKQQDLKQFKNINIRGIHVFQWGNILNIEELSLIWNEIGVRCSQLAKFLKIKGPILDLGGGIGIPYLETQKALDFKKVCKQLSLFKKEHNFSAIWMELGRYCVGPIGKYIAKIIDKKIVYGQHFLILDGGINHLARHALTGESFPCSVLQKRSKNLEKFQICGPLCTALDKFGEYMLPKEVEIGDHLIFHQTGAYGFTESMPYFLCHPSAGEVIFYQNDLVIPRLPKLASDWLV